MKNKQTKYGLEELHANNLADFMETLGKSEHWLASRNNRGVNQALGVFNTSNGLLHSSDQNINEFLTKHEFVEIRDQAKGSVIGWFDNKERQLWRPAECEFSTNNIRAEELYSGLAHGVAGVFGAILEKQRREIEEQSKNNFKLEKDAVYQAYGCLGFSRLRAFYSAYPSCTNQCCNAGC